MWVTSRTGQIMWMWVSCNHKQLHPQHALECDYFNSKDGSTRRPFYVTLHKTVGRTDSFTTPRQWRHIAVSMWTEPKPKSKKRGREAWERGYLNEIPLTAYVSSLVLLCTGWTLRNMHSRCWAEHYLASTHLLLSCKIYPWCLQKAHSTGRSAQHF